MQQARYGRLRLCLKPPIKLFGVSSKVTIITSKADINTDVHLAHKQRKN